MEVMEKANPLGDEAHELLMKVGAGAYVPSLLDALGRTSAPKGAAYEALREQCEVSLRKLRDAYGVGALTGAGGGLAGAVPKDAIRGLTGAGALDAIKPPGIGAVFGTTGSGKSVYGAGALIGAITAGRAVEAAKNTVQALNKELAAQPRARRRKASPKVVALLERWKNVPSVDPDLLREDNERLFDSSL